MICMMLLAAKMYLETGLERLLVYFYDVRYVVDIVFDYALLNVLPNDFESLKDNEP